MHHAAPDRYGGLAWTPNLLEIGTGEVHGLAV